ncbi:predicted protein [Postia placenta Mad-698-R]|nr:predicted protein [Postia placenta Mad-698-R]
MPAQAAASRPHRRSDAQLRSARLRHWEADGLRPEGTGHARRAETVRVSLASLARGDLSGPPDTPRGGVGSGRLWRCGVLVLVALGAGTRASLSNDGLLDSLAQPTMLSSRPAAPLYMPSDLPGPPPMDDFCIPPSRPALSPLPSDPPDSPDAATPVRPRATATTRSARRLPSGGRTTLSLLKQTDGALSCVPSVSRSPVTPPQPGHPPSSPDFVHRTLGMQREKDGVAPELARCPSGSPAVQRAPVAQYAVCSERPTVGSSPTAQRTLAPSNMHSVQSKAHGGLAALASSAREDPRGPRVPPQNVLLQSTLCMWCLQRYILDAVSVLARCEAQTTYQNANTSRGTQCEKDTVSRTHQSLHQTHGDGSRPPAATSLINRGLAPGTRIVRARRSERPHVHSGSAMQPGPRREARQSRMPLPQSASPRTAASLRSSRSSRAPRSSPLTLTLRVDTADVRTLDSECRVRALSPVRFRDLCALDWPALGRVPARGVRQFSVLGRGDRAALKESFQSLVLDGGVLTTFHKLSTCAEHATVRLCQMRADFVYTTAGAVLARTDKHSLTHPRAQSPHAATLPAPTSILTGMRHREEPEVWNLPSTCSAQCTKSVLRNLCSVDRPRWCCARKGGRLLAWRCYGTGSQPQYCQRREMRARTRTQGEGLVIDPRQQQAADTSSGQSPSMGSRRRIVRTRLLVASIRAEHRDCTVGHVDLELTGDLCHKEMAQSP